MKTKYDNNRTNAKDINIKERVQNLCKEKQITQSELARKIGISKSTLSDNLRSDMRISTLCKISEALNVRIIDLLKE